jgi:Short C-terminal domain
MWRDKSEARLKSLLTSDEKVVKTGDGFVGLKEAFVSLTNKRVFIFRLGTTKISEPKMTEIDLRHVRSIHCEPPFMTRGPMLVIDSRSGKSEITLHKAARKEAGMWPKWILEAQERLASAPKYSDDVASHLAKLAELHKTGALTSDEFAAAKARILGT